ncbi:DUF6929 family protein [Corallococcus macrosporus]|uniref:Uncharacterized protein n=1 Tax=Corallococcus macrosporus DSM 14697 TaxID=1189310 RepID=A0A250JLR5_9BACT|nr:hypothetical protein [Corallococcus macrosporus]ATB44829.1 hypothetical protein MYMAC_000406 [Corallococcus macrosporus DSM 14697]
MIHLTSRRTLDLEAPVAPGRPAHVTALSGLVRAGAWLYTSAEEPLHLAAFPLTDAAPGHGVVLFANHQPDEPVSLKSAQPDLEVPCLLGPLAGAPSGALLALPTGATEGRRRGAVVALGEDGALAGEARAVDVTALYTQLSRELGPLRIAGAALSGGLLRLFQRGSGEPGTDALVDLDAERVLRGLEAGALGPDVVRMTRRWELGQAGGMRLSFTAASPLSGGRMVFSATAGSLGPAATVGGSVVGVLAPDGSPQFLDALEGHLTVTGVDARVEQGRVRVLLAALAEDGAGAATLLEATLDVPA